jgi:HSP20 family protein
MSREDKRRKGDWEDFFDLFGEGFDDMRSRMDRILDDFMKGNLEEHSPLIYGFSMRVGPDGLPNIQEFGNTSPPNRVGEEKALLREPLTDIIESEDKVTVIMELPGVDKSEIRVNASDRSLDLEVDNPDKRFFKQLVLPCDVLEDSAKASYKNGVLQVVMTRAKAKKKARPIEVE